MADDGHRKAHTRADPAQAGELDPLGGADPGDLLTGSPDLDAQDVLSLAAELVAKPRRARGRPAGAANRKNSDMIAYLQALGHRDPWVTLSLIQTADTQKLAQALRSPAMKNGKQLVSKAGTPLYTTPSVMDVFALQVRAADALMPYHHGKKPQQLDLGDLGGSKRPVMVIGEMNVTQIGEATFMSAGEMPETQKANEINGEVVREDDAISHGEGKPSDINGLNSDGD